MKEKKRAGSTNITARGSLTEQRKQFSFKHPNRIRKKNQTKFIQEHPHFHFYLDLAGNIYYEKDKGNG